MRILLASDLHYQLRQYDWLLGAAGQFDALVVAGDHIDGMLPVPGEVQIAALSATLARLALKTHVLVCSGNHDLNARNVQGEKTADWLGSLRSDRLAVDGDTVRIGDTLFTVCPWWDGPHARGGVEDLLAQASALREPGMPWVWVYHAPPLGALSWTGKRHYADEVLPHLIERHAPTAVLCGHIHEAPFKADGSWVDRIGGTWLFNAGRQPGDVPTCIEIDLAAQRAQWFSMEGVEQKSLVNQ